MNNKQLQEMAKKYLDNGDFTVSGYARIEIAGVKYLAEEGDLEETDINEHIENENDFDGLSDWAHELAITSILPESDIYILQTLDVATHEQRLRYQAEMSEKEKSKFAQYYREIFEEIPAWL